MFANILIWLALVIVAGLFAWLARRALRLRNPAARWALVALATLPALLFALVAGVVGYGYYQFYRPRSAPAVALDTTTTTERIARGKHLALTTCVACHARDGQLPLSGGNDLSLDLPLPIGTLVPPNLTPGGSLQNWSDAEIVQAIRNGRHESGRTLLMPTEELQNLSDDDLASLIVFLRSQAPIQNQTPAINPSPLLAFFWGTGMAPVAAPPVSEPVVAPPKRPDAAYGAYIVSYQDCRVCHGADLNGSAGGLGPAAPSVRAIVSNWTLEQFIQTIRTGVDPGGHAIQPPMPWQMVGRMDDVELAALYHYIRSLK